MTKITFIASVAVLLILGGIIWSARSQTEAGAALPDTTPASPLNISNDKYDFGVVRLNGGLVRTDFKLTNSAPVPVVIEKIFTSCMCTSATLLTPNGSVGPFGMPGHGAVPPANVSLAPGETATLQVTFDPAAHGPAGIGKIERSVSLITAGRLLGEVSFTAMVKP